MKNIGIIAPSGRVENVENIELLKIFLEQKQLNVKIFKGVYENFRYMAGNDGIRLCDLESAYLDPEIDTIICIRGGYGAIRLLDKIDYDLIKKHPKKIVGSSDITALLVEIYNKTGQITYHAKMGVNGVLNMDEAEFLRYKKGIEENCYDLPKFKEGRPKGVLWGGNLATLVSLMGTDFAPKEDIILFLEDINEPDYKIDRMLTQILRHKPLKEKIKGVIFGEFIGAGKYLDEILMEFQSRLNVPFAFDDTITHGEKNGVVPVGLFV